MPYYLLTGAGFSRNWGGWLANEAFEYLLGSPQIDDFLRDLLWATKLKGEGFEGALSQVQRNYASQKSGRAKQELDNLTQAVIAMFTSMQTGFDKLDYRDEQIWNLQKFLARFDAIFTLNQDTLLETIYAGKVRWTEQWYGSYLPYMKFLDDALEPYPFMLREALTQDTQFSPGDENYQAIYKLHGSYNWFAHPNGERLLVMGGNKTASIASFQVLARYQAAFEQMLSQPDAHLMVIGYSFGDPHINKVIADAAEKGLRIFIIDTLGVDVIDKRNGRAQIAEPITDLMQALMPKITGASRRPLAEVLSRDRVENGKLVSFFSGQIPITRIAAAS